MMKNRRGIRTSFAIVGVLALLLTAVFACAPKAEPTAPTAPAKEVVINIGVIGDLTGPYAISWSGLGSCFADAQKWSDETGYMPKGTKLITTVMDTGGQTPKALTAFEHLMQVDPHPAIMLHSNSTEETALRGRYEEEIMPCVTCCGNPALICPATSTAPYFADIDYNGTQSGFCDWLVKDGGWKKTEPIKAACISWDSSFGKATMTAECLAYMKKLGIEFVGFFPVPFFPTDTQSQLLAARDAGANMIFSTIHSPMWAVLLKDATRLGLKDKMIFVAMIPAGDRLLEHVGGDKNVVEGTYLVSNVPTWSETDVPGIALMHKFHEDNNRGAEWRIWGYITALDQFLISTSAIKASISKDGAEAVTNKTVMAAIKGGIELDTMGLFPKFRYGETARVANFIRLYQYQNGSLVNVKKVHQPTTIWPQGCEGAVIGKQ